MANKKRRSVMWKERMDYKEDATAGGARIIPKTYKNDAYVQVWLDSRKLATLTMWLQEHGYNLRFMSEIVRETIDLVVEKLAQQGVKAVETTTEARTILQIFKIDFNPDGRGQKNLMHNIALDEARKKGQFVPPIGGGSQDPWDPANVKRELEAKGHKVPEDFAERLRAEKEAKDIEEIKKSDEEMMKRKEMLRASGQIVELPTKEENEQ